MEEEWPTPAVAQTAAPSRKKKEKKVPLTEFLSGGSWADEMMETLPTGSASRADDPPTGGFGGRGGFNQSSLPRGPACSEPLPTRPPYTAYVGNLPFDIDERELERMFEKVTSARIVRDKVDDRPKGFGYVEFETVDALSAALGQNGKNMGGRSLRVNVAEPPKERTDRIEREDRTDVSTWRRTTPLNNITCVRRADGGCYDSRGDFAPGHTSREREVSRADSASAWTSKWTPSEPRAPPPSSAPRSESSPRWGSSGPRRVDERQPDRPIEQRSEPKERPKLALKPRSAVGLPASETENRPSKSNPFGSAKPRDEDKALKEAEERRKQREQEQKDIKEKGDAAKSRKESNRDTSSQKENRGTPVAPASAPKKTIWNKEGGSPSFATLAAKK